MNLRRTFFVLVTSLLTGNVLVWSLLAGNAVAAQRLSPDRTGAWAVPANRIVGLWDINVTSGPCLGGPTRSFVSNHTYHAGGTLTDAGRVPPTTRGPGQGIWEYQGPGRYKIRFQFNRFLPDGSFDGVQEVRNNNLMLNAAGTAYTTSIYTRVLNPDGSLRTELCGAANAQRIAID